MMGIYGNYVLTNAALYVRIGVSMKVDEFEHIKAKDRGGEAAVFHLGYMSFSFPSNHLLMKFANTLAATERTKSLSIYTSFQNFKEAKTIAIIYHILDILAICRNDNIWRWIASATLRSRQALLPLLAMTGARNDGGGEWQNLTTFNFVKKRNVQFACLPIIIATINCVILLCGAKGSSFGPVLVYKVESSQADNLATVCGNSEMMGIYGIYILTNTALYVRIGMSMKIDNGYHAKSKDRSGLAAVFHLGYLSFIFPSYEALIRATARVCDAILHKLFVKNARFATSKAVLFASILCKISISATHRSSNQRFTLTDEVCQNTSRNGRTGLLPPGSSPGLRSPGLRRLAMTGADAQCASLRDCVSLHGRCKSNGNSKMMGIIGNYIKMENVWFCEIIKRAICSFLCYCSFEILCIWLLGRKNPLADDC